MPAQLSSTAPPLTRRQFLQIAGAALGSAALLPGQPINRPSGAAPATTPADSFAARRQLLPEHPNLILLITDQERYPQHWPAGWDYEHRLPGRWRLAQHGLTFERAFCNSAMCSPSRGCLFTGLYPAQHTVDHTLTYDGPLSPSERTLPLHLGNLARMLASAGYHVSLKGKWHLSKHADGSEPDSADVAAYGFLDWEPTTAGEASDPVDFGGGCADWDQTITTAAVDFLGSTTAHDPAAPFALIVSLANPHDVLAYPRTWDDESETGCFNYRDSAGFDHGIELPPSLSEDLSTKPAVQETSLTLFAAVLGALNTSEERLNYVNFYADLQMVVDGHIDRLLDTLELQSLADNTIVVRLADHGELGLSHGGLRQKMFNAYEEAIHVPLVISNPQLFPTPQETGALAALVDIMPTLASLLNLAQPQAYAGRGYDLSPILADPAAIGQDTILFTFDDDRSGTGYTIPALQDIPHHLQAIRVDVPDDGAAPESGQWKYVRYYNPEVGYTEEYELYQLTDAAGIPVDPDEVNNLANDPAHSEMRAWLAAKLALTTAERLAPLPAIHIPLVRT